MLLHYSPKARYVKSARDLSHIELARSDNISSSSKARTYRVGEAHISTERKTIARISGKNPSILALSVCKGVWAKPIYAFDQTNAMLALLSKCQFSAKDITLCVAPFFKFYICILCTKRQTGILYFVFKKL